MTALLMIIIVGILLLAVGVDLPLRSLGREGDGGEKQAAPGSSPPPRRARNGRTSPAP